MLVKLMDSSSTIMIDSISGDYEDSFSLETFADMIHLHHDAAPANSKGFIIARVQTRDSKQPNKAFYSYYDAFHLIMIYALEKCSGNLISRLVGAIGRGCRSVNASKSQ